MISECINYCTNIYNGLEYTDAPQAKSSSSPSLVWHISTRCATYTHKKNPKKNPPKKTQNKTKKTQQK